MTPAEYLALPIRFSHLKSYGRSAMHGYHSRTSEWEPTEPMLLGTAVHALAFGTGKVVSYPKVRRGKEWEAFKLDYEGFQILTESAYDKAHKMSDALLASSFACDVMQGISENTILFDWFGRKCRATPDVLGSGFVTDLKTCQTSDPEKFVWHSLRFSYHAQMAMQCEAAKVDVAYLVAIESTEPYPVTVFRVTDEALRAGHELLATWMDRLKTCEESGKYPPYSEMILPLDVPEFEYPEITADDDVPPLEL